MFDTGGEANEIS